MLLGEGGERCRQYAADGRCRTVGEPLAGIQVHSIGQGHLDGLVCPLSRRLAGDTHHFVSFSVTNVKAFGEVWTLFIK